ncbi:hypothetical protein THAOC_36560, partial [Thalassiosira oceanica]
SSLSRRLPYWEVTAILAELSERAAPLPHELSSVGQGPVSVLAATQVAGTREGEFGEWRLEAGYGTRRRRGAGRVLRRRGFSA